MAHTDVIAELDELIAQVNDEINRADARAAYERNAHIQAQAVGDETYEAILAAEGGTPWLAAVAYSAAYQTTMRLLTGRPTLGDK